MKIKSIIIIIITERHSRFSLSWNCVFMFKNNAICSLILELASEDPVCCCPLILFTIDDFSQLRFVEFRLILPNSGGNEIWFVTSFKSKT